MANSQAPWMHVAEALLGESEISTAAKNNPRIVEMFRLAGTPQFRNDETAWCAAFANAVLICTGYSGTKSALASSFFNFGRQISEPVYGCIVAFVPLSSGASGHVGFYVGDAGGSIKVLGGNQSDSVRVSTFPKDKVRSYRLPVVTQQLPAFTTLPTIMTLAPEDAPAHLRGIVVGKPELQEGDIGPPVVELQRMLGVDPDGEFGPNTRAAVEAFQELHGLEVDGVVGPDTWAVLERPPAVVHEKIKATVFNDTTLAYGPVPAGTIGVSLPARIEGKRPLIWVRNRANGLTVVAQLIDVGPWNGIDKSTDDPYWKTNARPQAESGIDLRGRETNKAGIDLNLAAAQALGVEVTERNGKVVAGEALVDWGFAHVGHPPAPAPVPVPGPVPAPVPGGFDWATVGKLIAAGLPFLVEHGPALLQWLQKKTATPEGMAEFSRLMRIVSTVTGALADATGGRQVGRTTGLGLSIVGWAGYILSMIGGAVGTPIGDEATQASQAIATGLGAFTALAGTGGVASVVKRVRK